jgi:hypothetical protein
MGRAGMVSSGWAAVDAVTLLLSLAAIGITGLLVARLWRSEARLRLLLSYLLFLRSRRRRALVLFSTMVSTLFLAALVTSAVDLLQWPSSAGLAVSGALSAVAALSLLLFAYFGLREATLTADEREALRAGSFSMYTLMEEQLAVGGTGIEEAPAYGLAPPEPPAFRAP